VALGSPPSLCRPSTWAVPDRRVLRSNILRGVKAEKPTPSSSSRWNDPCRPGGGGPGAIFFQMIEILWSVNPTPIVLEPMERSVPARGVEVLEPYFFGRSRSLRSLTPHRPLVGVSFLGGAESHVVSTRALAVDDPRFWARSSAHFRRRNREGTHKGVGEVASHRFRATAYRRCKCRSHRR
jgi:hypothetical protein